MTEEVLKPSKPVIAPQSQTRPQWLRHALFVFAGLLLLASGAVGGYWYRKISNLKSQISKPQLKTQKLTPTPIVLLTLTPLVRKKIKPTIQPIAIPSDWKKFTDTDPQAKLTVTLSVPPGYSFAFSGSEWNLGKFNEENWDYSSSIIFNEKGKPENMYDGGSRRRWYQQYLNDEFSQNVPPIKRGEIVSVKEHGLGSSTYLEVKVNNAFTKKLETHYLYVQNNILHVVKPQSGKAFSPSSVIAKNIAIIFASLESHFGE